jgi:hypothetical protein
MLLLLLVGRHSRCSSCSPFLQLTLPLSPLLGCLQAPPCCIIRVAPQLLQLVVP